MFIETSGKGVQRGTSPLSWKNKWGDRAETAEGHGGLCVRGRFGFQYIDSKERLGTPLVRTEEGLAPRSWFEVMYAVVGRLEDLKAHHNADARVVSWDMVQPAPDQRGRRVVAAGRDRHDRRPGGF